ncbi:MAG: STAS domain-containing protein [Planctomycetota bacterium]|jgi:anti-sigma B factor antagonist
MEIEVSESRDVWILSFQGNLDTNTSPDAESEINGLIDGGAQKLLVNFENLHYISSAGLRVLLATAKKLKASGGDLRICCLNQTVQEVFDISGFATILSVTSSEEEALGSF